MRVSLTLPQDRLKRSETWAATKGKIKKAYTMVTDSVPAIDAETAFQKAFKAGGGEIVGSVRMPIANPDFSAFVQRRRTLTRNRSSSLCRAARSRRPLGKAFAERGMDPKKIKIMSTGEAVDETAAEGASATSRSAGISAWHYDYNHKSKMNADFVESLQCRIQAQPGLLCGWRL